eukprot:9461909-Pyramimonas_sp.AAC.1
MAPKLSKPAAMSWPATTRPASASHDPAPFREALSAKAIAKAEAKARPEAQAQPEVPGMQMEPQMEIEVAEANEG